MYLSHLRKTEIWNLGSVLRILWNEFRNYLDHIHDPVNYGFEPR